MANACPGASPEYLNSLPFRDRFREDPILAFTREILDPDKYGEKLQAPDSIHFLTGRFPKSIPQNWVAVLNPRKPAHANLTDLQVGYKNCFRHFLDFLNELYCAIAAEHTSVKYCTWIYPWLKIIAAGIRYVDVYQCSLRGEIRREIEKGVKLSAEQAEIFNNHGIHHWYGIFKPFIMRYNPKVLSLFEMFGVEFDTIPNAAWMTQIDPDNFPGLVKIDRWEELNNMEKWVSGEIENFPWWLGLWRKDQHEALKLPTKNNIEIHRKDFYFGASAHSEISY